MKKLVLAASVIMLLAVSCNDKKGAATGEAASSSSENTIAQGSAVYFNIDSLVSKYDMYTELRGEYETKAKNVDADLTNKGRALERDIMDYQDKAQKGLVTRAQAQTIEAGLTKKQQDFVQLRDNAMNTMGEEEQVMLNKIHYSIVEYLKEFNSDYKYSMIISTNNGGPIMNANPDLDVTKAILEGLNKKYAQTKNNEVKK